MPLRTLEDQARVIKYIFKKVSKTTWYLTIIFPEDFDSVE